MIFLTVGTTLVFDDLVKKVDSLIAQRVITEPVLCQIGAGKYVPEHCESFRYKPQQEINSLVDQASMVIAHGGTGTVLGLLAANKRFVAVANPLGADDHQRQFLENLGKQIDILWTADLEKIAFLIARARDHQVKPASGLRLADDLRAYLWSTR